MLFAFTLYVSLESGFLAHTVYIVWSHFGLYDQSKYFGYVF